MSTSRVAYSNASSLIRIFFKMCTSQMEDRIFVSLLKADVGPPSVFDDLLRLNI